jgi:hypothetical protein
MKFGTKSERDVYAPAHKNPTANDCILETVDAPPRPLILRTSSAINYFNESMLGIELGPIILLISCVKVKYFRLDILSILH